MVINNWNVWDGNVEKGKKDESLNLLQFKKDFVRESLILKKPADKNNFINEIMTADSLSGTNVEKELILFSKMAKNQEKYPWIKLDDIDIKDLKWLVVSDFLKLKNSREYIKEKILLDYEITSGDYDKKVEWSINKLNPDQITDLINKDKKLTEFLKKEAKFDWAKREKFKIFAKIKSDDIKKRLKDLNLDEESMREFMIISEKYNSTYKLSDDNIRFLFSIDFFKKDEKAEFIHTFIPFITLAKAVEINLLSHEDAEERKKEINKKILVEAGFSGDYVDEMSLYLSLSDIKISTKDIDDEDIYNKLSEKIWFVNFEEDLKELSKESSDEYIKRIQKNWQQNLDEFILLLKKDSKIKNPEKFKEWHFIEFTTTIKVDGESKIVKQYVKITWNDENEKKFSYTLVGSSDAPINIKWSWNPINMYYGDFLETLKDWKLSLDFFTEKEMKEKIETLELVATDYESVSAEDLKSNPNKKLKIQEKYKIKLKDEIAFLQDKIDKWDKSTILQANLEDTIDKLNKLDDWDTSSEKFLNELSWFENFSKLLEKLDEIDPDWKNIISDDWRKGLFKWMIIKTKEWWFFEITCINLEAWTIWVKNTNTGIPEPDLLFSDFYTAFKKWETKRVDPIKDMWDLLSKWYKDNKLGWWAFKDKWSDHELVDWKIIAKWVDDWDETWVDREVEYLVSGSSDEIIKILSTSGWNVEIQRWTRKNLCDLDKNEAKKLGAKEVDTYKKYIWEVLYIGWAETEKISITELESLIKNDSLYPNWQTWKAIKTKSTEWLKNNYHWSFWSKVFSNFSVSELVKGWQMFVESFKETLKKWNEIHAAKAALAMWFFLPDDLKQDLKIKVEGAEKKEMDKEIEDLWRVDSPIAIARILKWLKNKDVAEHKKEAWMLFMLEKYWHLSAKFGWLYAFRWKWLWYEAFGWRINDKFFLEIKKRCEDTWVSFSEEFLMLHLLKQQCKEHWFNWIHRRTRLHKEYENKWSSWVEAEFDKWYKDGSNKRTAATCVYEWMLEAKSWTSTNSLWWFKKAIEIWWSLEDMSEWFFCLLYSGVFTNLDEKTFKKVKALWDANWLWIIMTRFFSTTWEMRIFNDAVLSLSERIETLYGSKYSWIAKEAREIYEWAKSWTWNESDRLEKTQRFWKKYNKVLVWALNMTNTDVTTHSKTDKIIFLEKDQNEAFNKYYNRVRWYSAEEDAFNSKIMNDGLKKTWVSWLNGYEMARRFLGLSTQEAFRDTITWNNVWDEMYLDFKSVNNKKFAADNLVGNEDRKAKEKYLLHALKNLTAGLITNVTGIRLKGYNYPSSNIWKFFNSIGLDIYDDLAQKYSVNDILLTDRANAVLMKSVNKILDWVLDWSVSNFVDPLAWTTESTKLSAQALINPLEDGE